MMFQALRYHFWLRLSELVDWLGFSEDTRRACVIRAAQHVSYSAYSDDEHACDNCDARVEGTWDEARAKGWAVTTDHEGELSQLCPECQEPAERVESWT